MAKSPYQKQLKDYVSVYGVSYKTVQRWAAKGYPLDDEAQTRAMAAGIRPAPRLTGNAAQSGATNAATAPTGGLGMGAASQRLREMEAQAHAAFIAATDDDERGWRLKEYLEISDALRKAEKEAPDIANANKEAVRIADVSAELGGLFRNLRSDLDTLGKRLAPNLVGKDAVDIRLLIEAEAGLIVAGLFDAKYLRGVEGGTSEQ